MNDKKLKIVIIEPDITTAKHIEKVVKALQLTLIGIADSKMNAKELMLNQVPDLMIVEADDPSHQWYGIDIVKEIDEFAQIPVIYLAKTADVQVLSKAQSTFLVNYLLHPVNDIIHSTQLKIAIEMAIKNYFR